MHYNRLSALIVCFLLSFSAVSAELQPKANFAQQPTWVKATSLLPISKQAKAPIHYRLYDQQVNAEANFASFTRLRFVFEDSSGIQDNSSIRVRFNPAYETVSFHHVQLIRNNKIVQDIGLDSVKILNAEDGQGDHLFSGEYDALIVLKDIRVGDELDYSYTISGQNPIFKGKFSYYANLGFGVSVDKLHFNLVANTTRQLQVKPSDPALMPTITRSENKTIFQIERIDTPVVIAESDTPAWYSIYPFVQFSEYQDWQTLKGWAKTLFAAPPIQNKELMRYIAKLQTMDKRAALNEAIRFTQDEVRYLGMELGVNSHLPHSPNEVFANRYGDCKDKALLLSVLLEAIGIKASPILVSTMSRQEIANALPSHQLFDHVINRIEFADKYYYVDATRSYQGRDISSLYQANYGKALLVDNSTDTLVDVQPTYRNSKISIDEQLIAADYFSPVQWHITTTMEGYEAESFRYQLASQGREVIENNYINFYANQFPHIEMQHIMVVQDDTIANVIKLHETYLVPKFWNINNQSEANFSLTADYARQYLQMPQTVRRKTPLAISDPVHVKHSVTLQLPEYIDFSALTESFAVENKFIRFSSRFSQDRKRLNFVNEYQSLANHVPVSDVTEYLTKLKTLSNHAHFSGFINNVKEQPYDSEFAKVLESIRQLALQESVN